MRASSLTSLREPSVETLFAVVLQKPAPADVVLATVRTVAGLEAMRPSRVAGHTLMVVLAFVLVVLVALGTVLMVSPGRRWDTASRAGVAIVLLIVLVLFLTGRM
jgi:hypothetical protein